MKWDRNQIIEKLTTLDARGYIPIPEGMYRRDEGVIGQILEREFGVKENNLPIRDLGEFELKGMRTKSSTLTLCHKTSDRGLSPIDIFYRFGYVKPSQRDNSIIKKKLFTTIKGTRVNPLGFQLQPKGKHDIEMYYGTEFLCSWNLESSLSKIDRILLVIAETQGTTNSCDERFHYIQAYLMSGLRNINDLVKNGTIVVDLCIDQDINATVGPHDRGPHIRIPKAHLGDAFDSIEEIFRSQGKSLFRKKPL